MEPLEELRSLYFNATRGSIARDFARAIDLIKAMPDEETRGRAIVYMEGLAQMRSEWAPGSKETRGGAPQPPGGRRPRPRGKPIR